MKKLTVVLAVLFVSIAMLSMAPPASAYEWFLKATVFEGQGWNDVASGDYDGSGYKWASGFDGVRRAYYQFDAPNIATDPQLYDVYQWVPTAGPGGWQWQPIEVNFNGFGSNEEGTMNPNIPWAGQWGTNHQYAGQDQNAAPGTWQLSGPGPQTDGGGTAMWMQKGSWLYIKWNFGWDITHAATALKIVGDPVVPEPSSMLALLMGVPTLVLFRRKK